MAYLTIFIKKASIIREKLLPENDLQLAETYEDFAFIYFSSGEFGKAIQALNKANKIYLKASDPKDESVESNKDLIKNYMAQAVAHLCKNTPITKVVAITKSGFAARSLSLLQI